MFGSGDKAAKRSYSSSQTMNFFGAGRWLDVEHGSYFLWIRLYSLAIDDEPQEFSCGDSEGTFCRV